MFLLLLLLSAAFVCIVFVYKTHLVSFVRAYRMARKFPVVYGYYPVIGHTYILYLHRHNLYPYFKRISKDMTEKSQKVAVMWLGPIPFLGFVDPEDAQTLCNECLDKSYIYDFASSWVGQGLVTAKYELWRAHRKLISPSFNAVTLNNFLPAFNEAIYEFLDGVESKTDYFDPMPLIASYNMSVLCQTVLGLKSNSITLKGFEDDVKSQFILIILRFVNVLLHSNFIFRFTKYASLENEITSRLKAVSQSVIEEKNNKPRPNDHNSNNYSQNGSKFKPFLDLLLVLRDEGSMSEQEVREELDTMIVAGYDTTYSALSFILPVLGQYQQVQQKAYEELQSIFGESNRDVNKDDLNKMVYIEAVIKETLRIHPIALIIARRITKPLKLRDYSIEDGCDAILLTYGINHNKCWGEDRYEFNPDRWLNDNVPKHAFASFGIGRRDCIGKTYSMMSMKTLLSQLIRRYEIIKEEGDITTGFTVISKPIAGHKIKLKKRMLLE